MKMLQRNMLKERQERKCRKSKALMKVLIWEIEDMWLRYLVARYQQNSWTTKSSSGKKETKEMV